MTENQKSSPGQAGRKHLWVRILLPVFVLLSIVLLARFFRGTPYPPISDTSEKVPPAQILPIQNAPAANRVAPAAPKDSSASLNIQLQQVLAGMREAHQKKDLPKLLSYYSPNFPSLAQRTQSVSKAWKIYDYPKIDFEIADIKPIADHAVMARVTWEAEAKNIHSLKSTHISKTYLIRFVSESGQWRIQALQNVQ
jgi:hypothetical protein